jgi:hypothetical protein
MVGLDLAEELMTAGKSFREGLEHLSLQRDESGYR